MIYYHDPGAPRDFFEYAIDASEGTIAWRHEHSTLNVYNRDGRSLACRPEPQPAAGRIGRVIRGTNQSGFALDIFERFALVEDVIPRAHPAGARRKNLVSDCGRHTRSVGRVFDVDHRELGLVLFLEPPEIRGQDLSAGSADNVADDDRLHRSSVEAIKTRNSSV